MDNGPVCIAGALPVSLSEDGASDFSEITPEFDKVELFERSLSSSVIVCTLNALSTSLSTDGNNAITVKVQSCNV